jgi:hypothetical protein
MSENPRVQPARSAAPQFVPKFIEIDGQLEVEQWGWVHLEGGDLK